MLSDRRGTLLCSVSTPCAGTCSDSDTRGRLVLVMPVKEAAADMGSFSHRHEAASSKEDFEDDRLVTDLPSVAIVEFPNIAAADIGSFSHRNDSLVLRLSSISRLTRLFPLGLTRAGTDAALRRGPSGEPGASPEVRRRTDPTVRRVWYSPFL